MKTATRKEFLQAKWKINESMKREENGKNENERKTMKLALSCRWLFNFKKHIGIYNVRIVGESTSADNNAAARFPNELKKLIEKEGYQEKIIFNMDETSLYWQKKKILRSQTFLAEKESTQTGYKI